MIQHLLHIVMLAVLIVPLAASRLDAATWQVGLSRHKITPPEPIYLAGYASRNKPFESVADDLHVKALALADSQKNRAVLVTADLIGFRAEVAEPICRRIMERTGLERRQILLGCSHTHTGPLLSLDPTPTARDMTAEQARATVAYTRQLIQWTADTAVEALGRLQPARLAYGTGVALFVMNRREFTPRGVRLGVNPSGLADRTVPVLKVESPDGQLRAVLYGVACHNTTLTGRDYLVSGDFAGISQISFEKEHPGTQAMFMIGCAGAANPYPRGKMEYARQHGHQLAAEVQRVVQGPMQPVEGPLRTELDYAELPLEEPPSAERLEQLAAGRMGWQPWMAGKIKAALQAGRPLPTSYRAPVAVWQFGDDLTLVGLSGEVVVDYVPLIQRALGPLNLWIAAYTNDVFGYVPSARTLAEGGYETRGLFSGLGFFAPETEHVLVEKVRQVARRAGRGRRR